VITLEPEYAAALQAVDLEGKHRARAALGELPLCVIPAARVRQHV
jgi:hypothetical protein